MATTVIKACDCASEFQDQQYGKGQRVHNVGQKNGAVCTVCGKGKK